MKSSKQVKFLLINPTSQLWRVNEKQKPINSSVFRFSMLPSLYVAASVPSFVNVKILDEDVEPIDFETDADLIGISFMTYNAPRAYELAKIFKAKGKTVIFGGYHPSFMADEAIQYADAICIGEAEINLPHMIEDYLNKELKPFYKSDLVDLDNLPVPDRSILNKKLYLNTNAMQATRGCYHRCEFCSVASFNEYHHRKRPIGAVIDEIKTLGHDILFMDDNIALDKDYAKELFTAMIPLKKRWFSQCEVGIGIDDELLQIARKSGCRGLFLGFESLSEDNLKHLNKHGNRRKNYMEIARNLHQSGIAIFGAFVFGSDLDDQDVFEDTLDFLLQSNIEVLQSTRLTPFPGTPLFEKLDKEHRIIDKNWSHYDFFHVVHKPMKMSAQDLHEGTAWIQRQFYSYKNISRRVLRASTYLSPRMLMKAVIPLNLGYRFKLNAYGDF